MRRRSRHSGVVFVLATACTLGMSLSTPTLASSVIYVNGTTGDDANNGLSWGAAKRSVQAGIDAAAAWDSVWVAAGTYKPTTDTDRTKSFVVKNWVYVYGGFAGNEDPGTFNLADRNLVANLTTLTGDLAGNDNSHVAPDEATRQDNSYHVVVGGGAALLLDGFTITGGNANGVYPNSGGGGIRNDGVSIAVSNCTFARNSALWGGGASNRGGASAFSVCTFIENAVSQSGGGTYNESCGSGLRINGCSFTSNVASGTDTGWGGGIYNYESSPAVGGCTFTGNTARLGAGMRNNRTSSPVVSGCTFTNNSAQQTGGGMANSANSNPTVSGCTFTGNSASGTSTGWGGGISNYESSPAVGGCTFTDNSAQHTGGGMVNDPNSNPTVSDCTFSGNTATWGAGMCNNGASSPSVGGCTFNSNAATSAGGGMCNDNGSSPSVTNCTFNGNTAGNIYSGPPDDLGWGGGMANWNASSPVVTGCTFNNHNYARRCGGGMENEAGSTPRITNCVFSANGATWGGGLFCADRCNPVVANCVFTGNWAGWGGGVQNETNSGVTLTNCTLSGNRASAGGGGVHNYDSSNAAITNCILWGNTGPTGLQIYNESSTPTVTYTDIQGGYAGAGNISADPLFDITFGDGLRVGGGSPCIDAGNNAAVPAGVAVDPTGNPRFLDDPGVPDTGAGTPPIVDMGAYEGSSVATPTFSPGGGTYSTDQVVTVSCATPNVTIHYTTNGAVPTVNDPIIASGGTLIVDHNLTLKASAWKDALVSPVASANYQFVVAGVVFSPDGGTYATDQQVTVTCATAGAVIHYTINGVEPTEEDPVSTSGSTVLVDHTLVLRARAWKAGYWGSDFKSATYQLVAATPSFSPNGGTYSSEQQVTVTCSTPGATIHYTTNGVDPTEADPIAASGATVLVDRTMTLKARAWKGGYGPSAVKSAIYHLAVAAPVVSPGSGSYTADQQVTVTCATPGAVIHYTTGGADPTESDPVVDPGDAVLIDHSLTLKAKAWKTGWDTTGTTSAVYTLTVATPTLSPNGGVFRSDPAVMIACATPAATVRYTINGADPTEADPIVDSGSAAPLSLDSPVTLKVKAWKAGCNASAVASGDYRRSRIVCVSTLGDDSFDGAGWVTAKRTVQGGIDAVGAGDQVWVAMGTYKPTSGPYGGRDLSFAMKDGVSLYGGFAGDEDPIGFRLGNRNLATNVTRLSGDLGDNDEGEVRFDASRQDNVYNVVTVADDTLLDGVTITGGNADGGWLVDGGGGILNWGHSVTLRNCVLEGNAAPLGGAIMVLGGGRITTIHCILRNNYAVWGGAAYAEDGTLSLYACVISRNSVEDVGGAVAVNRARLTSVNCTVSGNSAVNGGGAIYWAASTPAYRALAITSSIVWGNTVAQLLFDCPGDASLTYSNIQEGDPGTGNISVDPLFVDPGAGDLRLQVGSPCIDAGDNAAVPADGSDLDGDGDTTEPLPFDLAGHPRFVDDPTADDCRYAPGSCGTAPIVDMGAYEYIPAVRGDFDSDTDVDMVDFGHFQACFNGPNRAYAQSGCENADFDADTDVDLADFGVFRSCFNGPNRPPACG